MIEHAFTHTAGWAGRLIGHLHAGCASHCAGFISFGEGTPDNILVGCTQLRGRLCSELLSSAGSKAVFAFDGCLWAGR